MSKTWFAIRVDLTDPDHNVWEDVHLIETALAEFGVIVKCTFGREEALKTKKDHYHMHFELDHEGRSLKKGMSSWLKRKLPTVFHDRGYSIQTKSDEPTIRWYGYVFKDYLKFEDVPTDLYWLDSIGNYVEPQKGFSRDELFEMWAAAKREREQAKEKFEKFENKMNNDMEVRAKTWAWLDEQLPNLDVTRNAGLATREQDPAFDVAVKLVEYHRVYNNFKIPMDLKRRVVSYLSYRGASDFVIANYILR